MSLNRSLCLGLLCVLGTLASYACDDNDDANNRVARIGPTRISFVGQAAAVNPIGAFTPGVALPALMTLQPALASPQALTGASCPIRPPFQVPFSVLGTGHGRSDLFVDEVQMRFVDRAGVVGGAMTMARPQLADRFGSTHLPAVGTRSFPFTFPFGCVGLPVGTLQVVVVTGDSFTHDFRTSLAIDVR
jgi:hypothetical protein